VFADTTFYYSNTTGTSWPFSYKHLRLEKVVPTCPISDRLKHEDAVIVEKIHTNKASITTTKKDIK